MGGKKSPTMISTDTAKKPAMNGQGERPDGLVSLLSM
jgi:hypothetical protein